MRTETLALDAIRPYWRNPRRITDAEIDAVAKSIEEYGYTQPIVVDAERVIIVGHTRYAALRRLGQTEVPVLVADHLNAEQVKQYRIIDNRAGEFSSWDFEKLMSEAESIDAEMLKSFFPDLMEAEQELAEQSVEDSPQASRADLICPKCFHEWVAEIDEADVTAGTIPATAAIAEEATA